MIVVGGGRNDPRWLRVRDDDDDDDDDDVVMARKPISKMNEDKQRSVATRSDSAQLSNYCGVMRISVVDILFLKRALLTYVRPLVEHNSVVWSPCYKKDIEAIERVLRRFSKRLPGLKNLSYEERLKYLG